ncbi:type II methionyl aminopeptidase [Candidatus Pacearchaeota archaeon]|jgi:methionyl aminopeptidase|nr:type II methionyl aminopeptidase [Candidatus Pacearchaeota archaeon]
MNRKEKIIKAGKIASEIKTWIKPQIKKGTLLVEIAEKIESKIIELGGKPAFPTNLSINEIAAHFTPSHDDKTIAEGLLKVDFGVHVDGFIADTAFSVDLENSAENKKLIEASEKGLHAGIEKVKEKKSLGEIGEAIQKAIESYKFSPIVNLTGHEMNEYELHSGLTIFNVKNSRAEKLGKGLYAMEPFSTNGSGKIYEGKPSEIYLLIEDKNVRNPGARELLNFIVEEYKTLPFCSRWIVKKFGTKALFSLRQLEMNGNIHNYPQLIEGSKGKVAQTENTIFIDDEIIVTSE